MSICTLLRLTKLEKRALAGVGSRWEGGDAVVVTNGRLSASLSWLLRRRRRDKLGCRCGKEGGRGEVKGVLWPSLGTRGEAPMTRGRCQPPRGARRLTPVSHHVLIQLVQNPNGTPDSEFSRRCSC